MLQKSLEKTTSLCFNIAEDRNKHIQAIEAARQKKIYDNMKEFQDEAIKTQNGQESEDLNRKQRSIIWWNSYCVWW